MMTLEEMMTDDREWFEAHPDRYYRARMTRQVEVDMLVELDKPPPPDTFTITLIKTIDIGVRARMWVHSPQFFLPGDMSDAQAEWYFQGLERRCGTTRCGVMVFDIDPVAGGLASLAAMGARPNGKLPTTVMAEDPSGSRHYFYKASPPKVLIKQK